MKQVILFMVSSLFVISCSGQLSLKGFQLGEKYDEAESLSFETNLNGVVGNVVIETDLDDRCIAISFFANSINSLNCEKLVDYTNENYDVNLKLMESDIMHLYHSENHSIMVLWEHNEELFLILADWELTRKEEERKRKQGIGLSLGKFKIGEIMIGELMDLKVDTTIAGHKGYLTCNRTDDDVIFQISFVPMSDKGQKKIINTDELNNMISWVNNYYDTILDNTSEDSFGNIVITNNSQNIAVHTDYVDDDHLKATIMLLSNDGSYKRSIEIE